MKKIIIQLPSNLTSDKMNSMIQAALNNGFIDFFVTGEIIKKLKKVERLHFYTLNSAEENTIPVYSLESLPSIPDLIKAKKDFGVIISISNKTDEKKAIELAKNGVNFLICKATDWKIIPFENLIANTSTLDTQLYADVGSSLKDVEILFHTLEKGVHGVVFTPNSENDFGDLKKLLKETLVIPIEKAKITKITMVPEADRVCVDTSSMLRAGEGMLVGNTAKGFALVHAEVFESEFVNSRPFRVNAGDVSDYILVPQFEADGSIKYRTNYLSELKAGDKVLIVNTKGETRVVSIGRVKIETRPMILFETFVEKQSQKIPVLTTVQNAETVRLILGNETPISVTKLKVGDEILVHVGPGATHFGTAIKETIIEK